MDDNTLNYQLLYADMAEITGFNKDGNRTRLYESVTEWFRALKLETISGNDNQASVVTIKEYVCQDSVKEAVKDSEVWTQS